MLNKLLIYRLLVLNICGLPLVALAYSSGMIDKIVLSDTTFISHIIVLTFLVGLVSIFIRAGKISAVLDGIKNGRPQTLSDDKIRAKAEHIDDISTYLVRLGLLGTVVGFGMALDIKDIGSLNTATGASAMIGTLLVGMKVAINTTITGAVLSLWLDLNSRVLKTATECALADARDDSWRKKLVKMVQQGEMSVNAAHDASVEAVRLGLADYDRRKG